MRISIHVHFSPIERRQVLEIYQVTSLLPPRIAENHSDYTPVLLAILEIIPRIRHDYVTALAITQRISPKRPSTLRQIGRFAKFANN